MKDFTHSFVIWVDTILSFQEVLIYKLIYFICILQTSNLIHSQVFSHSLVIILNSNWNPYIFYMTYFHIYRFSHRPYIRIVINISWHLSFNYDRALIS